jgi:tryptophan-rich sensory protein
MAALNALVHLLHGRLAVFTAIGAAPEHEAIFRMFSFSTLFTMASTASCTQSCCSSAMANPRCAAPCRATQAPTWTPLAFSFPVIWCCLPFHGYVGFHFLCAESLEKSFVVVALWSYIVLVSAYRGRLLLLHLF